MFPAHSQFYSARKNARFNEDHERGNEAVYSLSSGERLKKERASELGGILGEHPGSRLTDDSDALSLPQQASIAASAAPINAMF